MSKAAELAALIGSQTALSNRNLVINGAMQVAQRGTSATVGPNGTGEGYTTVDRWQNPLNGSVVSTFSQSTDAPSGFANSAKIEITTADSSLDSHEFWFFRTALEGQDVQSIGKGTSGAKAITLSFWVKSNKTGTYTVEVKDSDNDRAASRAYTVNSSNTWEHKTLTYNADTTGEFGNDNGASLRIQFWLVAGSQYQGGTFSDGTFESETDANRVHSSQVNLGDTVGNEWYITGIQLEVGEQATPFEHRSFGDELIRCQRYFERSYEIGTATGTATGLGAKMFQIASTTTALYPSQQNFTTVKRAAPTMVAYSPNSGTSGKIRNASGGTDITVSSISNTSATSTGNVNFSSSSTDGHQYHWHWTADAEL